jgi:hypothetical protein
MIVMLLSQIFTPFAYAVGEVSPVDEETTVVEETVEEVEEVTEEETVVESEVTENSVVADELAVNPVQGSEETS